MSLIPKRHTEGITTMNNSTTTKPAVTAIRRNFCAYIHWPLGRRPDDHPGLSDLSL
jgi:nuclear transport factor 2 (NTF2) superfamily protein